MSVSGIDIELDTLLGLSNSFAKLYYRVLKPLCSSDQVISQNDIDYSSIAKQITNDQVFYTPHAVNLLFQLMDELAIVHHLDKDQLLLPLASFNEEATGE